MRLQTTFDAATKRVSSTLLGSMLDTGRGTVLVVDERPRPRERLVLRLLRAGFRVAAAGPSDLLQTLLELREAGEEPWVVARACGPEGGARLERALEVFVAKDRIVLVLGPEPGDQQTDRDPVRSAADEDAWERIVLAALEERVEGAVGGSIEAPSSG